MIRAAGRLLLIGIIMTTIFVAAAAPDGELGSLTPIIVDFSADASAVSYGEVEAGTAQVTLSWRTVNTNAAHRISIDTYLGNRWVSILAPNEAPPLSGERLITVQLPENYGVPTYRITIKTGMGLLVGQHFLTIPYETPTEITPGVISLTTPVQGVDTHLLVYHNARVKVSWEIEHRLPDTQLYFEQIFEDERGMPVDIQGFGTWVPSSGEGTLIPRTTFSKDPLHFRLNLVSLTDGTRYDWADITIPVIGDLNNSGRQATVRGPGIIIEALSIPQNMVAVETTPDGMMLSAQPQEASTDGSVVLNWEAQDAETVQLIETITDGPKTLYIELPPTGSMTVPVPADSAGVTYTLRALTASGEVVTSELNISPEGEPPAEGE